MTRRPGLKWNYFDGDVLGAWVAEMDFGLAPTVAQALHDAIDFGDTGYPYPGLERAVAEAATRFWAARFDWMVDPARVFPAPDVIESGRRAIAHLTRPGSSVILPTPVYFPFFSMIERAGREVVQVPSHRDEQGRYTIDIEGIAREFGAGAGSIVLCNPWNPVGMSLTEDEVGEVVDVASTHGARVISDEVHGALIFEGRRHFPAARFGPKTVVTVTSASKAWNIPGLKSAQVVLTNDDDLGFWEAYFTPEKVGVGTFGLIASAAAYDTGAGWLDEVLERLEANRKQLSTFIGEVTPRVRYVSPEATYMAWLDLTDYGWDDPAGHILEHTRVALTGGEPFGIGGEGHVRLNFATDEGTLTAILDRIATVL